MSSINNRVTLSNPFYRDFYRHVALTISGNTHTLYLDGSAVAITLSGGNFMVYPDAIQQIYIGCAGDLSYGFSGIIDDFKIWNRALPFSDISFLYNNYQLPITPFTNLMRITGLINWYDASDPNGNGIIPSNGATISTWVDKSTYANNMIAQAQYNEGYVSTYATYATNSQNGLGTINFNKSWYRTVTPNAPYPCDVYVVVKLNSLDVALDVIGLGYRDNDNFNSLSYLYEAGSPALPIYRWHNGSTFFYRTPNAVAEDFIETSTGFLLMQWSIANNNFYIYRNGVQIMYTNTYTWTTPPNVELRIGNRFYYGSNQLLEGSIAEVACFNNQLDTTNRQTVEGYLAWKWGLQNSLPIEHPYYSSMPY